MKRETRKTKRMGREREGEGQRGQRGERDGMREKEEGGEERRGVCK